MNGTTGRPEENSLGRKKYYGLLSSLATVAVQALGSARTLLAGTARVSGVTTAEAAAPAVEEVAVGVEEVAARTSLATVLRARVDQMQHIVLGLDSFGLRETARRVGGVTLMKDPNWKSTLMAALGDDSIRFTVSLRGFRAATKSEVLRAAQRGAAGTGGATDWELAMLYQSGRLETATFLDEAGNVIENFW